MAELVTGEAVALDIRVARLASRGCAILLDVIFQLVILNIVVYFTAMTALVADEAWAIGLTLLAVVAVLVGYPCAFETLTRGRTLGKMAVGLRVVSDDGGRSGSGRPWCGRWPASSSSGRSTAPPR